MSLTANEVLDRAVKWIEVPPASLQGKGLEPYPPGGISTLFDWVENEAATSIHLMPHAGQFIVDVVEIEPNAVHQHSKPGDEVVVVLHGSLVLTTDNTHVEQTFNAGEMVMIPAGWAGIYRVTSQDNRFRELCILPGNYFSATPGPSGHSPRRLEPPLAGGRHEIHRNIYSLEVLNVDEPMQWSIDVSTDEVIRVIAGTLTLTSRRDTASFDAGSVVILPKGFSGKAAATAGYRALDARWIG